MRFLFLVERFYTFLVRNSNLYRLEDPLVLLSLICSKNRKIVRRREVDIEDYFIGKYDRIEKVINKVVDHY